MPVKPATRSSSSKSLIISAIIGVILFVSLSLLLEGLFRWTRLDGFLQLRSMGVYHNQFEIKWFTLKDFVRENNGVDVIILGNSMVNTGIDPVILSNQYAAQTGNELRVFNFGVEGLTVAPNSVLARLLVQEYHPGALIFVTEMRDYTAANGVEVEEQLLSDEWLTARLGAKTTFRTWLIDNSPHVQHLLPFRNWSREDFPDTFLMSTHRFKNTTPAGYEPDRNTEGKVSIPPNPDDPAEQLLFEMFANYTLDPGRLENLADILALNREGTQILITELPLHPNYFVYFGGERVHEDYLAELVPFITSRDGVFLPPLSADLIPDEYRSDYYHLNYMGAGVYSALLADQLAALCVDEGTCLKTNEDRGQAK